MVGSAAWDGLRLRLDYAPVDQQSVQLVVAIEAQPRLEEALADKHDLVLDLTFPSARGWRVGRRARRDDASTSGRKQR